MSIRVMTKVWEEAPYSEGTLLTLLALADWANDEGVCWPHLSQLATKARLSVSGARYCLRKLVADKAVTIDKDSSDGRPRILRLGGQYLPPRGAVSDYRGGSNQSRNKEEPSLKATVKVSMRDRGTRIPEHFIPNDEHYSIAADLGINCELEFQRFRDHYLGVSGAKGVKLDWDATLRNWLRNSLNFGGRSSGREPTKAEQRVINSRRNITDALRYSAAAGAGSAGVPDGSFAGADESLDGMLQRRKT